MQELNHPKVLEMKNYIAHSNISVYDHSLNVMRMSMQIINKFNIKVQKDELLRGALLHDFYLYDWHDLPKETNIFKMHGFTHPHLAFLNASKEFNLTPREENIIESHMFPLTISKLPRCREAWIVCVADKIVATKETFQKFKRKSA